MKFNVNLINNWSRTNNKPNIYLTRNINNRIGGNMSGFDNNHWTKEEKVAFETWLKISIEMIEKYCTPEEKQESSPTKSSDSKAV